MDRGFLVDETQGGRHPAFWAEGVPERSWLTGTKLRGHALYVTETFRCRDCGALRSYALDRKR